MRRTPTLAALALAAAAAVPARADAPPQDCQAYLVAAAAGATAGCNTMGVAPVPQGANRRVLDVYAIAGTVRGTLFCGADGLHSVPASATVEVTAPGHATAYVDRTAFCYLEITALANGTTAVATNNTSRTVD